MTDNIEVPDTKAAPVPDHSVVDEQTKSARPPLVGERFRDKVYLAIIVAVLSFMGGAGGTFLAFRFESEKWQRETSYTVKKEIFTKRMELLERTIKAVNRLQTLDFYQSSGSYSLIEGKDLIQSGKAAAPSLAAAVDGVVKIKEAQAELSAVMTLDYLYFGRKTKQAIGDLQKALGSAQTWWQVDKAKTQALIDATAAELQVDLI